MRCCRYRRFVAVQDRELENATDACCFKKRRSELEFWGSGSQGVRDSI